MKQQTSSNVLFNSKLTNFNKSVVFNADSSYTNNIFAKSLFADNIQSFNSSAKADASTSSSLVYSSLLGTYAPFTKTFVIRGIGYQADIIEEPTTLEFPYNRYLSLRVGHSFLIYKPIPNYVGVKVTKKDRKLVIYGANKEQVANFSKTIFLLRTPSVYTGRGIRIKKGQHRRKLGKKDIRKGKA